MNSAKNFTMNDTICDLMDFSKENIVITVLRLFCSASVVVSGGTGNALVMLAYANPRMKTVTNLYIANLAFADFLVSVINVPTASTQATLTYWPFGLFLCKVLSSLQAITLAASIGTLIAIAIDRFNAIVRPYHNKLNIGQAKLVICAVWLSSVVFSSPLLIYTTELRKPCSEGKFGCIEAWTEFDQKLFTLLSFLLLYFVPLTAICVLYYLTGRKLTNAKKSQTGSQRAKKKVIRMLVTVVIVFAVCCLPYHVLFLYINYIGEIRNSSLIYFVQWLFYANSACNPIVYAVFNTNYRREFIKILRCRCFLLASWCNLAGDNDVTTSNATFRRSTTARSTRNMAEDVNALLEQNGLLSLAENRLSSSPNTLQIATTSSRKKGSEEQKRVESDTTVLFESSC